MFVYDGEKKGKVKENEREKKKNSLMLITAAFI